MNRLQMDAGNVLALAGAIVGCCVVAIIQWCAL